MPDSEQALARDDSGQHTPEERALDAASASGDHEALGQVLDGFRPRIARMIAARMDPRLVARLDVSDVIQDALVEVTERLPGYLAEREQAASTPEPAGRGPMPFFLWVRFIAGQKLAQVHRHHLGADMRDAHLDVDLAAAIPGPNASRVASVFLQGGLTPSGIVSEHEAQEIMTTVLEDLAPEDREILALRHFEQLSNGEIARLLGLTPGGASLRHLRAVRRFREALDRASVGGG